MTKFIVLDRADIIALNSNKPVDTCIDKINYKLCTEEYYLENVVNQPDEVMTKKGVMTRAEAQKYYEGVLDGFRESEKLFREENKTSEQQTGHWIDDKCSVCGKGIENLIDSREWYRNEEPKFCPFCGILLEWERGKNI